MSLTLNGLDTHQPSRVLVENNTGVSIAPMKAVALNGMGALYPQVVIGNPSTAPIFGIALQGILTGANGQITTIGIIPNLDTSAWPVDTKLYSDATGNLLPAPLSPGDAAIATVLKQDAVFGVLHIYALASQYAAGAGTGFNPNTILSGYNVSGELAVLVDASGNVLIGP